MSLKTIVRSLKERTELIW